MTIVFGGMAASLDGYIRSVSGDLSWLKDAMSKAEDYGFAATEQRACRSSAALGDGQGWNLRSAGPIPPASCC
ncbi:hypothetical protein [Arthrobacter nitrophenolicus]|uniref:Uncharacterized protein n=1 Tax=Arthrobacter nitrophenolicus TaxID=683150 RepID=A0ACC6TDA4_9MICC|nr:hypothetical protein [Arthrobacter nitrophenolicus]